MHHRTVKNGQWNLIYSNYVRCIDNDLLLKVASESNNNHLGMLSKGFLQKRFGFLPKKHVLESRTQGSIIIMNFVLECKCS